MNLNIDNIGMIKSANVEFNGLTLIAGENDTGKSTIGKSLLSCIKAGNISFLQKNNEQKRKEALARMLNHIFDGQVSHDGKISLSYNKYKLETIIKDGNFIKKMQIDNNDERPFRDATLVQSPLIFDLASFFYSVSKMKQKKTFEFGDDDHISYPYVLWDLYEKISKNNKMHISDSQKKIDTDIIKIISGEFKQKTEKFYYHKYLAKQPPLEIEIFNTAYGIKSFAILQLLNKNNYFRKNDFTIFDEPEVHLHPEWQIEMAKIIVMLIKQGTTILVNSHSPYMIQALIKFSKEYNIESKSKFYLMSKEKEMSNVKDVTNNTNEIFSLLAKPMNEIY